MSNISELANVPQISFIENMTLQETEEQLKAEYARIYREQTGKELVLGEADAKTLLLKAFALIEYQTMQYADIKGQAELLKTSTGEALGRAGCAVGADTAGKQKGHGQGTLFAGRGTSRHRGSARRYAGENAGRAVF